MNGITVSDILLLGTFCVLEKKKTEHLKAMKEKHERAGI